MTITTTLRAVLVGLAGALIGLSAVAATAPIRSDAVQPYIVVLKPLAVKGLPLGRAPGAVHPEVGVLTQDLGRRYGFAPQLVYSHALQGFSARLSQQQLTLLRRDARIAFIEPDQAVKVRELGLPLLGASKPSPQVLPWGIDRIEADLSSTQAGDGRGSVAGVRAYIIDTGIASHADLNVVAQVNFAGGLNTDCHGHGTHVAGTVGARDNAQDVVGVAPGVELVAVKVLDCLGTGMTSTVIKGVDWVTANASTPAVVNMSLGGEASVALDSAVLNSAARGLFYAVAAGNDGKNACQDSPARVGQGDNGVMTTAATDAQDQEASFSNYGACVDVWAPGVNILSTAKGGGTTTMSGTSMASPHAAGAAALYLSTHPGSSPVAVESVIKSVLQPVPTFSKDGAPVRLLQAGSF